MDNINENVLTEEEQSLLDSILEEAHGEQKDENKLPEISPTAFIEESTSRFSSAEWFNKIQEEEVLIAGIGGIGSWTSLLLSRLHVKSILAYDMDTVDNTNLSGQFFGHTNIGANKVYALYNLAQNFSNYFKINGINTEYNENCVTKNVMICGFDNMAARKVFFNNWKKRVNSLYPYNKNKCLFIDGRLAAEEFQVYCIRGDSTYLIDKYENECLFTDSEAENTLCSYKQTSFCANMIASVIINLFVNFIANQCGPIVDRELPFCTYYDAERMYFKTTSV